MPKRQVYLSRRLFCESLPNSWNSFFQGEKFRRRNFKCSRKNILPKLSDARNFIYRQSRTLDLLFAASPPDTLFFPWTCLSPRPHSLLLPVVHGIIGIIACIVFHLPMTPYFLCLLQESGAWGRHSYFRHFSAGLAQSVERLIAEREVTGSIPGAGPIPRALK